MKSLLVSTISVVIMSPWAAVIADDIDVVPGPRSSSVNLSGTKVREPSAASHVASKDDAHEETYECDQGPGAKAAGLSCNVEAFPGTFGFLPDDGNSTPADIERAIREVPMPPLKLHIQPDGRTLVNVDTIFYAKPTTMRRTVTLLGHGVRLECTPVRFTWVHGDGTTASTGRPGRPYPAKDVTHRYQQPGDDLQARVDTTYSVRYSVDGGPWADLAETLTAPGPSTALDVDEAVPVLTH